MYLIMLRLYTVGLHCIEHEVRGITGLRFQVKVGFHLQRSVSESINVLLMLPGNCLHFLARREHFLPYQCKYCIMNTISSNYGIIMEQLTT